MKILIPACCLFLTLTACNQPEKESAISADSPVTTTAKPLADTLPGARNGVIEENHQQAVPINQIIPGKSVGLIKLNEEADVVQKLLGEPVTANTGMGKSLQTWHLKTKDGKPYQLSIFFSRNMGNEDEKSRAKQIRITDAAFKTEADYRATELLLRANIQEAKKTLVYKLPGSNDQFEIYDNVLKGIAFEFDPAGNVIAITVHEPGKAAFEVFTDITPDLKKMKPSEQTTIPFPGIKD